MSDLNYKPMIHEKVREFFEQNPNYTFGQLVYSVQSSLKLEKKSDLLEVSDEDFYTGLDLALGREKEE